MTKSVFNVFQYGHVVIPINTLVTMMVLERGHINLDFKSLLQLAIYFDALGSLLFLANLNYLNIEPNGYECLTVGLAWACDLLWALKDASKAAYCAWTLLKNWKGVPRSVRGALVCLSGAALLVLYQVYVNSIYRLESMVQLWFLQQCWSKVAALVKSYILLHIIRAPHSSRCSHSMGHRRLSCASHPRRCFRLIIGPCSPMFVNASYATNPGLELSGPGYPLGGVFYTSSTAFYCLLTVGFAIRWRRLGHEHEHTLTSSKASRLDRIHQEAPSFSRHEAAWCTGSTMLTAATYLVLCVGAFLGTRLIYVAGVTITLAQAMLFLSTVHNTRQYRSAKNTISAVAHASHTREQLSGQLGKQLSEQLGKHPSEHLNESELGFGEPQPLGLFVSEL
ncbi:uncharacterized protein BJ171DRAFT_570672 [Polychytrium aggregatum]|uniref:uncharacterized protein n=1 Tax=Polychytrium aggregatum TaxID=110093 RepID=UPI0022FEA2E1|nr:uncharacterized protein BJ171DRAFT_570672 [Polychytrium aggregatum]KAI9197437.1 hypothetical protein BJ171DRAFT_570672 [Polychytrium aggregatum]